MVRVSPPRMSRLAVPLAMLAMLAVACSSLIGADFGDVHEPGPSEVDAGCAGDACGACIPLGESCAPSASCCGGAICNSNDAKCEACGVQGGSCRVAGDCCGGFACDAATDTCQPSSNCSADGTSCVASSECCSSVCNTVEKECDECGSAGKACTVEADCCESQGFVCDTTTGACVLSDTCIPSGTHCADDAGEPCCGQLVCNSVFSACQACGGAGSSCTIDGDCCSGTTCNTTEGQCQTASTSCGLEGTACSYTASCCESYYCALPSEDAGAKSCTSKPTTCGALGDTNCLTYADCCEGDGTAGTTCCQFPGVGGCSTVQGCCIVSDQDTAHITCYQDTDCCSDSCNTTTGQCN